jgi:3-hydroxymyristoyl/3-hydroxydecanoyl-(acyl carrier protein) dehydratase
MRFLLFDKVTHFEPGKRIEGLKCITLADESLKGHFSRKPLFPAPLVLESMLQLTAWTAIAKHEYRYSLVLSVVENVVLPADLGPGTTLRIVGELKGTNPKGSMAAAWCEVEGERVASAGRILYAHIPVPDPDVLRERFRYYGGTP